MIFLMVWHVSALSNKVIDVVIPCHEKDAPLLGLVIEGIKKYGKDIRRVIVVSSRPLTEKAEWFDEAHYPFIKDALLEVVFNNDKNKIQNYKNNPHNRVGWLYQQLLKLYAPLIIPNVSKNVLILDADTIFLNKVTFIDDEGYALYDVATEYHEPYFRHARRLLPGFTKIYPEHSGICHHMLMQPMVIEHMFKKITEFHQCEPWIAICKCIDTNEFFGSFCSEYELYFNFVFENDYPVKIRKLTATNIKFNQQEIKKYQKQGYHSVSCHSYIV